MRFVIFVAAVALAGSAAAQGDHYVSGYTKANGTYVAPHYQTNPNSTRADNYSTRGNVNPYTGQPGTKPLYPTTPTPAYGYHPAPVQPFGAPPPAPYGSSYGQAPASSSYGFPPPQ